MAKENQQAKQKDLQKKYIEYQVAEQQMKQVQQQLEKLEAQMIELSAVEQSIDDMSKTKTGEEVLVPVSGGVFFKATVKESKKFLVNVGGGVVVEKGADETKGLLHEQAKEMENFKDRLTAEMAKQLVQQQELEKELKSLIEE
jgi:prefoldin alpha subunit